MKQLGDKAEALQLVTQEKDDWTAITDAIGADGKTLRKIAQCYTLSFLIAHANQEIRKFNSRYELQQVKHSLASESSTTTVPTISETPPPYQVAKPSS